MGMLIEGRWRNEDALLRDGAYVRPPSVYAADLDSDVVETLSEIPASFLLIASMSCPWSHRTLLVRSFKGLTHIPLHLAHGRRTEGYSIDGGRMWRLPGTDRDIEHLHQIYALGDPTYTGRATVPVLWNVWEGRVASNESSVIMRALDSVKPAAASPARPDFTLVPNDLRSGIDALNAWIGADLSNAVYQAGFAASQTAYDDAVERVFATLDALETRLTDRRFLMGGTLTEADLRLFPTLARFDSVYDTLFRCARRRLIDYPNLWSYARDLYALPGFALTLDVAANRRASFENDRTPHPFGVPGVEPDVDWLAPHDRADLGARRVALRNGESIEIDPALYGEVSS